MAGKTLDELGFTEEIWPRHFSVKEAVFPFVKFPGVDTRARPRDEEHRRGDGDRLRLRARVREGADRGRQRAADARARARLGARRGPRRDRRRSCASSPTAGFAVLATPGTADVARGDRASRPRRVPKVGRAARGELDTVRPDRGRRRGPRDQHRRQRSERGARLRVDPAHRAAARAAVLHDRRGARARARARSARSRASRSACASLQEIHPSA